MQNQLNYESYEEIKTKNKPNRKMDHSANKSNKNRYECTNGILLEPRLQEYLKKKTYFKKNNIQTNVNHEQEFNITEQDVKRLKAYLKGDKDLYNHTTQEKFDFDDVPSPKFEFDPDEVYKSDVRYQRFAKKLKRDKEAMKQRYNQGDFHPDYETAFLQPDINKWTDDRVNIQRISDERMMFSKENENIEGEFESKYKTKNPTLKNNSNYNNYEQSSWNSRSKNLDFVNNTIGEMNSYGHNNYDENLRANKKKILNASSSRPIPFVGGAKGIRNIGNESYLKNSEVTRYSKTNGYGYRNPIEHHFDYISNDIQDPNNIICDRGTNTRLDNRKIAGEREIIN